jgi:pimeloyl-ACP methyl ester carboxylesterase
MTSLVEAGLTFLSLLIAFAPQAVMDYVLDKKHSFINPQKVVLFGRSLGGAVAIYAAEKYGAKVRLIRRV